MTTARLPIPGNDKGTWGDILNGFLGVAHEVDGTLASNSVGSSQLQANAVTSAAIASGSVTSVAIAANSVAATHLADGSVTAAKLDSATQSTLSSIASKTAISLNGSAASTLTIDPTPITATQLGAEPLGLSAGTLASLTAQYATVASTVQKPTGGTDGQFLAKSGSSVVWASASGGAGAAEIPAWSTGRYYAPPFQSFGTGSVANYEIRFSPIYVPNAVTVSEIAFEVTTAGSTGATQTAAIYGMGSDGRPSTLIGSGTAQDCTTTGKKASAGLLINLSAGIYFFATLQPNAPTTQPVFRTLNGNPLMTEQPDTATYAISAYSLYGQTTFPATITPSSLAMNSGTTIRVQVKV